MKNVMMDLKIDLTKSPADLEICHVPRISVRQQDSCFRLTNLMGLENL